MVLYVAAFVFMVVALARPQHGRKFEEVESGYGDLPTVVLLSIVRSYFSLFFNNRYLSYLVRYILSWLLFPLKYLDLILKRRKKSYTLSNPFLVCRKHPS